MADQDSNLGKATPDTVLSDWPNVWHMLPTWQGTADSDRLGGIGRTCPKITSVLPSYQAQCTMMLYDLSKVILIMNQ